MVSHVYAEDRSVAGARRRRVSTTIASAISVAAFVLLFSAWARSASTVDNIYIPLGSYTKLEAATGNGRLVFVFTRSATASRGRFHYQSRLGYPGGDAALLQMQNRALYYTYFGRDWAGFVAVLDGRSLAFTVPYWFPVLLSGAASAWFTRLWWLRRMGRHW